MRLVGRRGDLRACGRDRASDHGHGDDRDSDDDGDGRDHLERENDRDDGGGGDSRARLCLDNAVLREPPQD
jgi:hypothetical protein